MIACVLPGELPELIYIVGELADHDALVMLSVGYLLFDPDDLTQGYVASLKESSPFLAALTAEMVDRQFSGYGDGSVFRLYCECACMSPNKDLVLMSVGLIEPDKPWASDDLRAYASQIVGMRRVTLSRIASNEAMGIPCDDEYSSFLTSQSDGRLPQELLATVPGRIAIPGNSNGKSSTESITAPASAETLQVFLDRFKIDKTVYEEAIRPAT